MRRVWNQGFFAFFFRQYLLALIWPALGTKQLGRAPFDDLKPAEVDGTNAGRAVRV